MIERIKSIADTFYQAKYFCLKAIWPFYTKRDWTENVVRKINQPLARAYIEKINPGWKFDDPTKPIERYEEKYISQEKAREYIEKINYPWKFPKKANNKWPYSSNG
jgi:hypothetical protein